MCIYNFLSDQWLVLEQSGNEKEMVKCAKRKCYNQNDHYWPKDGFCYDAETARLYRLCSQPNTELVTNKFGNGYCGCLKGDKVPYVKVFSNDKGNENSQPCYLLYTQGPCSRNQVLISSEQGQVYYIQLFSLVQHIEFCYSTYSQKFPLIYVIRCEIFLNYVLIQFKHSSHITVYNLYKKNLQPIHFSFNKNKNIKYNVIKTCVGIQKYNHLLPLHNTIDLKFENTNYTK